MTGVEQLSVRGLADRYGVHRRTVRQALADAVPPARKTPVRAAPRLDPAKALIDAMLREDLDAPRKQRHTARRVFARLVDEHELTGLTYSTVRDYVAGPSAADLGRGGQGPGRRRSCRRSTSPARRPRSTSRICGSVWRGCGRRSSCSPCGCRSPARRCTGPTPPSARRRSWKVTWRPSSVFGGMPVVHIRYDNLKAAVIAGAVRPHAGSSRAVGGVPVPLSVSRRSTAIPVSRARTRRAAWRVRVAGSAATTWCRCPKVESMAELNDLLIGCGRRQGRPAGSEGRTLTVGQRLRVRGAAAAAAAGRGVRDRR